MKFGLKLWSTNTNLVNSALSLIEDKTFDYIELFIVPGSSIDPFLIDVPYIIHIPHEKFGVNIGDPAKKEYNLQIVDTCIKWADEIDARYLILHAGDGSMDAALDVVKNISDTRVLIENMTKLGLSDESMLGYSPEQIYELISVSDLNLCLDFGHAAKAALSLGVDYKKYIEEFMKLEPLMFHICDGDFKGEKDKHMNIGEGEYDFEFLLGCVMGNKGQYVTVETPRANMEALGEDVGNVGRLRRYRNLVS